MPRTPALPPKIVRRPRIFPESRLTGATPTNALISAGLPVAVINPRQIKSFARAMGKVAKSDLIEARIICEYGRRMKPELRPAKYKELEGWHNSLHGSVNGYRIVSSKP